MNANVRRFHDAEPPERQPHFREYVERHETEELYRGFGEAALVIDAAIYADLMVNLHTIEKENTNR